VSHQPDFEQFRKALTRVGTPTHLPFYEHIASGGFINHRLGVDLDRLAGRDYWQLIVEFWLGLGFDCVPMEIAPRLHLGDNNGRGLSHGSEARAVIRTRAEFDAYDWPEPASAVSLEPFEIVAQLLPEGAKIVGGVGAGPFEWVSQMMGVVGLSYALLDDPQLVADMFHRVRQIHSSAVRQLATMDAIGALRQGDDLGFKTATFLPPHQLREWVFPIYRDMVDAAHDQGKPFILHSCGNLTEVYQDIADCGVDAKHSFEDVILPVADFKRQYGHHMTPLGGLDVDYLCRGTEKEIRTYTRGVVEACFADGYYALGTGNSLTDYLPVANYLIALDEGRKVTG
jgi:uroporphyrinogen decarboxylase